MNSGIVLLTAAGEEPMSSIPGVVMLGLGMVFVGLICIIFLCKLMGFIFGAFNGKKADVPARSVVNESAAAESTAGTVTENRTELLAAVSAAIAEELGTDVSALRIVSFKKL